MEWTEAWGAFEDSNDLIGACAMVRTTDSSYRVHVAVVPERRRLEIGRELLNLIVDQAMARGARTVRGSHPFGASGAGHLIDGLELTSARRTANGQVDVVVFFPSALSRPEGTDIGLSGTRVADEPPGS
jgi:GNAT superfamily N-acetyltransferase